MSAVTLPKTWGHEKLYAADLNANFQALATKVNGGLDNTNLAAAAGIATSKIAADGGLTGSHLANLSVAAGKLTVGASLNGWSMTQITTNASRTTTGETVLASRVLVTRGGPVLILAGLHCSVFGSGQCNVGWRIKRDTVGIASAGQQVVDITPLGPITPVPMTAMYMDIPSAGSHTWEVFMWLTTLLAGQELIHQGTTTHGGYMLVAEFA